MPVILHSSEKSSSADLSWTCFSTERSVAERSLCGCLFLEMFFDGAYPDFLLHSLTCATYVVLLKENHMQLIEAATLDRKSGEAEGSAVLRTFPGYVFRHLRFSRAPRPESFRPSHA